MVIFQSLAKLADFYQIFLLNYLSVSPPIHKNVDINETQKMTLVQFQYLYKHY